MAKPFVQFTIMASLLVMPMPAQASDESRFTIDEYGWETTRSNDLCAARAFFVGTEGTALVELRKRSPSDFVEATVVGPDMSQPHNLGPRLKNWKPTYRLTKGEEAREIRGVGWINGPDNQSGATFRMSVSKTVGIDDLEPRTSSIASRQVRSDRFAQAEGLYLDNLFRKPVILETGPLSDMMKLMDACTDKMVESWGISLAVDHTLSRPPRPADAEDMIRKLNAQYPNLSQQPGTVEIIDFRLMLDAKGSVTACMASPGANKRFVDATCRVLSEQVSFEPALDAEGNAVPSYYVNTVSYMISA